MMQLPPGKAAPRNHGYQTKEAKYTPQVYSTRNITTPLIIVKVLKIGHVGLSASTNMHSALINQKKKEKLLLTQNLKSELKYGTYC